MKLDLSGIPAITPITKSTTESTASVKEQPSASAATTTSSEDRTTFKSGSTSVPSLVASALATPDVRQAKVDSIRQAINSGTYKLDAGKTADALIADESLQKGS